MSTRQGAPPQATIARGHERSEVSERGIVLAIIGLLAGLGLIFWAIFGLLGWFRASAPAPAAGLWPEDPGPQWAEHWVNPPADWKRVKQAAEARLESYGWSDRDAGIAHIPIERAMALLAQRAAPATQPAADEKPQQSTPQEAGG